MVKEKSKNERLAIKVRKLDKLAYSLERDPENEFSYDLRAKESLLIKPFEQKRVDIGLAIELPKGYIGLIRDRAGITTQMALHVVAGTVGPSCKGQIEVFVINYGENEVKIEKGMRIAQIVLVSVCAFDIKEIK